MTNFLQQQDVKNTSRRKKRIRLVFRAIQRVSLVVLVWLAFMSVIYGFYHLLFERGIFVVKHVEVDGKLSNLSEEEVKNAAEEHLGKNLFAVDLKKIQRRILSNEWVREAAVTRKLPHTVWIYVNEYDPFAVMVSDDLYMVDADGTVFKKAVGGEDKNFPAITGISKNESVKDAIELIHLYQSSEIAGYFALSEVNADGARGYAIVLPGMVVRLGFGDTGEKLQRLYSMLGAITSNKGKIRYIDLNMPGKVVVKYES